MRIGSKAGCSINSLSNCVSNHRRRPGRRPWRHGEGDG
jgi:hypothetical protein